MEVCHSGLFACYSERSEESFFWLRINSVKNLMISTHYKTEILRLETQNDKGLRAHNDRKRRNDIIGVGIYE